MVACIVLCYYNYMKVGFLHPRAIALFSPIYAISQLSYSMVTCFVLLQLHEVGFLHPREIVLFSPINAISQLNLCNDNLCYIVLVQ